MSRQATYGAYLYRDKDPGIDLIRTALRDKLGGLTKKHFEIVEQNGGPVVQTLDNWFNGDTRKPRNESLEAAGRAAGMHRVWQDMPRAEYERVMRQAARVMKEKAEAREAAARKRARKQNGHKKR
jgi:hypothetical protein